MLTNTQKQMVTNLRLQGLTYAEIAAATELSPNTVKSFCRRSHIKLSETEPADSNICKNCGRPLTQQIGTKKKSFCNTQCRTEWWNKNRRRHPYRLTCYCCGREFISFGNKKKKFCSRECRRLSRYGEDTA